MNQAAPVEVARRHRSKFSIQMCQSQIKMEPIRWGVMLWKVKGRHGESVCEERVFGSVSIGNLILCQKAQAKVGE